MSKLKIFMCFFSFLVFVLVLCGPLKRYYFTKQEIDNVKEKIILTKALNFERQIFIQEAGSKIMSYKMEQRLEERIKPTAIWLSDYLSRCGVWQFGYTEESKVPLGGQGRPIFSLVAYLSYSQALCVMDCFYRHSFDKKLSVMKLNRENNNSFLTLRLEMDVMK